MAAVLSAKHLAHWPFLRPMHDFGRQPGRRFSIRSERLVPAKGNETEAARQSSQWLCDAPRLVPAFNDLPNADFHLIAN